MSEVVVAPPSADRSSRSRAAAREEWLDRLARFPASGLTVAQFCAVEACAVPSFYYWKRRLAQPPDQADEPTPRLLPLRLQPSGPLVELVLPTGAVLRLVPGCDLAWLRSLLAVLGGVSC
jgi:hypothetical protein